MIDGEAAARFAQSWIDAWNSHDRDRILGHYAPGVVYHSPFAVQLQDASEGTLSGRDALAQYVGRALERYPQLHFQLRSVYLGAGSVVLEYDSVNDLVAAETLVLDAQGLVQEVRCHYRAARA